MGSLVHLKVHQGAFILSFPIVSCETLKKIIGPVIFFVEFLSKRKSNKNTLLRAAIFMQAMSGMLQCGWLLGSMIGLFKYNIGSKVCTEGI